MDAKRQQPTLKIQIAPQPIPRRPVRQINLTLRPMEQQRNQTRSLQSHKQLNPRRLDAKRPQPTHKLRSEPQIHKLLSPLRMDVKRPQPTHKIPIEPQNHKLLSPQQTGEKRPQQNPKTQIEPQILRKTAQQINLTSRPTEQPRIQSQIPQRVRQVATERVKAAQTAHLLRRRKIVSFAPLDSRDILQTAISSTNVLKTQIAWI